jgi:predicted ATPase
MLALAERIQDSALLIEAHVALGYTLHFIGEFLPTRQHFEQGASLYDAQQHRALAFFYGGADPGVYCLAGVAQALWTLGYPDRALRMSQQARNLAQELAHPHSVAFALGLGSRVQQLCRHAEAAHEWADVAVSVSTEQALSFWLALGTIVRGWALAEQRQPQEGMAQMQKGLVAYRATGAGGWQPYFLALIAKVYGQMKQAKEGLAVLTEALAMVDNGGERMMEAELYRLKGELTLQKEARGLRLETSPPSSQASSPKSLIPSGAEQEAEECFLKAIAIAQKQQAKSLELRAVMSLVRLRQRQAQEHATRTTQHETRIRLGEAHRMLSEIYNWFTEGFDTKDLQEASALLEELATT